MICLDTSFILDLLKKRPETISKLSLFMGEEIASTEINYFEVLYGVFKRKDLSKNELESVQNMFNSIMVLPLESRSAYKSAEIAGELSKKGLTIGANDALIAGICKANNGTILTKNIKHFSRINGLKIETY